MDHIALPDLFFSELEQLVDKQTTLTDSDVVQTQFNLLQQLLSKQTSDEHLHFSTIFSRVAYVCQKHKVPGVIQYEVHLFRKGYQHLVDHDAQDIIQLGYKVLVDLVSIIYEEVIPLALNEYPHYRSPLLDKKVEVQSFRPLIEVVLMGDLPDKDCFIANTEQGEKVEVAYNISERNENFNPTIQLIKEEFKFPFIVNLIDVEIDKDGVYRPKAFVILPDYLMGVTYIANCFKNYGTEPNLYLLNKIKSFESSPALMIGNIANYFLDELVSQPESDFDEMFIKVFRLNPMVFALMDDSTLVDIRDKSRYHFDNLKRVIAKDLEALDIDAERMVLEPSFYSQKYGIQGRLDALDLGENNQNAIIELKSGKIFKPNSDGINPSHYIQTLLYDLLVRSAYGKNAKSMNYILYSAMSERPLRYATPSNASQMEAIQVRNIMLSLEERLCRLLPNEEINITTIDEVLSSKALTRVAGFEAADLQKYEDASLAMTPLERAYFLSWMGFIAREQKITKLGEDSAYHRKGLSALWRHSLAIKEETFSILQQLELQNPEDAAQEEAVIKFARSSKTNNLANFRQGDLVVIYPYRNERTNVLKEQMFKCTLVKINPEFVYIRLRARQSNISIFKDNKYWNAEIDKLDTGFNNMYRSVYQFMDKKERCKKLILGLEAPAKPIKIDLPRKEELTENQQHVFEKLVASQDYFLLWGPPGTGKTSILLKNVVSHYLENSEESILLLAYTNRAVDEICGAIESIPGFDREDYMRIGSKYAAGPKYVDRLLSNQMKGITKRAELVSLIEGKRIMVGTLASLLGKTELFKLKKFDRCIVDEASQILEPMMLGMLPHFKHFTLIGDHKQLPAVVAQRKVFTKVSNSRLQSLGFKDLRDSYFERMYQLVQDKGWDHSFAQLSEQGRSHQELMQFSSQQFYHDFLKLLPQTRVRQEAKLAYGKIPESRWKELGKHRMIFINTSPEYSGNPKMNRIESQVVSELICFITDLYAQNDMLVNPDSLGVITPYRSQIACIKNTLVEQQIEHAHITVDTVERYQGGARDIVILSLCTNDVFQLDSMVSLNEEGIDRKLNVALTRARNQIVLIGNKSILDKNLLYKQWIEQAHRIDTISETPIFI